MTNRHLGKSTFPNRDQTSASGYQPKKSDHTGKRSPRRVLHFSDGVLEEYSTDEEKEAKGPTSTDVPNVDPNTLKWIPWVIHYSWTGGQKLLEVCDALGERIAWFLGITSPRYYYEIQEFKRQEKENERRRQREDEEMRGWRESGGNYDTTSPKDIRPIETQSHVGAKWKNY